MDRRNLKVFIDNLCFRMKFDDPKKEAAFKQKLEDTFIKYQQILDELDKKTNLFKRRTTWSF